MKWSAFFLRDVVAALLVPVAVPGDGPALPHTPIRNWTQLDSAIGSDSPAPNRSEALARRQSGRDYSQGRQACLAKSDAAAFVRDLCLEMVCADSDFCW